MRKKVLENSVAVSVILWIAMMGLTGCPKQPEVIARNVIASSKGVISTAQSQYKAACTADPLYSRCAVINKLVAAHNAAIDALEVYCAGPQWDSGAACTPHAEYQEKLAEAVSNLNTETANVKGIIK